MSARPDIASALDAGETLLWQGHPRPGRSVAPGARRRGALLLLATPVLLVAAGWIAIAEPHALLLRLVVYLLITTAALATYFALRVTVLDRRRARAHDARSAYAITDRRALAVAGPYRAAVPLGAGVRVKVSGDRLDISGPDGHVRFERLDDAGAARDILMARIGGTT